MEIFHILGDVIIFPNVTDDPATHILYSLKLVELIL